MATAIEYGLIAVLISVAAVAGISSLGEKVTETVTQPASADLAPHRQKILAEAAAAVRGAKSLPALRAAEADLERLALELCNNEEVADANDCGYVNAGRAKAGEFGDGMVDTDETGNTVS